MKASVAISGISKFYFINDKILKTIAAKQLLSFRPPSRNPVIESHIFLDTDESRYGSP